MHTMHKCAYSHVLGGTLETLGLDSFKIEPRIRTLAEGFKHLTELELQLQYGKGRDSDGALKELLMFLRATQDLRRLTLDCTTDEVWVPVMSILKPFSALPPSWPRLKSLRLSIDTMPGELLDLLRAVSASLRTLHLHDMIVGDVQAVFEEIPKTLRLETVYIENLFHVDFPQEDPFIPGQSDMRDWSYEEVLIHGINTNEPYAQAVKAYLLGKSDSLPRLQLEETGEWYSEEESPLESEHDSE